MTYTIYTRVEAAYGKLNHAEKALIQECYAELQKNFQNVEEVPESEMDMLAESLRPFETLKGYRTLTLHDAVTIKHDSSTCTLCILVCNGTIEKTGRYCTYCEETKELYATVLVSLPDNYGHILIRPETWSDKVVEVFFPQELDFDEHPEFSHRYYVLAKDESLARRHLTYNILNAVNTRADLLIEIYGQTLQAGIPKNLNLDTTTNLVNLGFSLASAV